MGKEHHRVKPYLLYTRYPLLYPARPSWAMLRRVMDVRNRIVANEYGIQLRNSLQYTAERLRDIAPGTLNERQLDNTLWKRYLYPSHRCGDTEDSCVVSIGTVRISMRCTIL